MNEEAYEQAVLLHQERVHAYARYMLRNPAEAQDVAQEALVRLWQHRSRVEPGGARCWLMRTTHNLCIDRVRKSRVRAEIDDGATALDLTADVAPGPQKLAESDELGRVIEGALASLSPDDRSVVVMREVQGLAYEEIAAVLGSPLGTIKARLHRARERLRARLCRVGVTP